MDHLIINAVHCNKNKTESYKAINDFLEATPGLAGMTERKTINLKRWEDLENGLGGISGNTQTLEGCVSIRTFDNGNVVYVDMFSTKPFSQETITEYARATFQPLELETRYLNGEIKCH